MNGASPLKRAGTVVGLFGLFCTLGALCVDAAAQAIAINPATTYQVVRGFGRFNGAGWIAELTPAQVDAAYGTGPGQIGLTIMRVRMDASSAAWKKQLPAAQLAKAKGATLFATPWSPPVHMKTNNNLVHGSFLSAYYADYATHLLDFATYMRSNEAELDAISVQNEPDYVPKYEGCQWTSTQFIDFLSSQGARFGKLKLMAPESYSFKKAPSDPVLNSATAAPQFAIAAVHLYGTTPSDYSLARSKGKELWMTEHYVDSTADANDWAKALPVAVELHQSMVANYSADVWLYIRRFYGLLTEDGNVSTRGHIMLQFAKYVRPGYVRIAATEKPYEDVLVTAYKGGTGKLVIIAVNNGTVQRQLQLQVASAATAFVKYRTTVSDNAAYAGRYGVSIGVASAYIDPGSVNTFVSQ
jgi:O-glycosyl hydrolase